MIQDPFIELLNIKEDLIIKLENHMLKMIVVAVVKIKLKIEEMGLVAVAIASTALANRHLSGSVYDQTSSYVNAQAGLNLGETILLTAESDELENVGTFSVDGSNDKFLAHEISSECLKPNDLSAAGNCFWWLGDVIHNLDFDFLELQKKLFLKRFL